MASRPPNAKTLWLEQEVDDLPVQTEQLRHMARRLKSRIHRGVLAFKIAFVFYVLTLAATIAMEKSGTASWFRLANFLAFLCFLFFAGYKRANAKKRPVSIVAASLSGLEFYKRQLEARLEHLRGDYRDLIAFGFAGAVAAGFALRNPAMGVSMGIFVAAFTLIKQIRNKRELPQIEQELNALRTYLQHLDRDVF